MNRLQTMLLIVLAGLSNACSTTMQSKHTQLSGFLGEYRSLLQTSQKERGVQGYRNPSTDWSAYSKVLLAPVIISEELFSELRNQDRRDLVLLAGSFEDKLYLKLSKDYEIVERPTTGTMLIQVAIMRLNEYSTTPAVWPSSPQVLQAVATPYPLADQPSFPCEITAEFKIRDAQTGELLVAGIDRRVGRRNGRLEREAINSWGDAKNSLEFWADLSAYRLCVLRGASDCAEPKV